MEHTLAAITTASLTVNMTQVIVVTAIAGLIGLSAYAGMKLTLKRTSVNSLKRYKRAK